MAGIILEGDHFDYGPQPAGYGIIIENVVPQQHPGEPAKYLVFETGNPGRVFGAGNCPSHPQTALVPIPANAAATVQAVRNNMRVSP